MTTQSANRNAPILPVAIAGERTIPPEPAPPGVEGSSAEGVA